MQTQIIEDKLPEYIIGAFSLVVALSWNEFFKNLFKIYGTPKQGLVFEFIYVMFLMLILVVVIYIVFKTKYMYKTFTLPTTIK